MLTPNGHTSSKKRSIAFVWENFGPMHVDRCLAVARKLPEFAVHGIEFFPSSSAYDWEVPQIGAFEKVTLFSSGTSANRLQRAWRILRAARRSRASHVFFCHYNRPEVTLAAWMLRLGGVRVFIMSCSKYDDRKRNAVGEAFKMLALSPFQGALSSGKRPIDYLRFLGIDPQHIHGEYNTLSIERIRQQSDLEPAPRGLPHGERDFLAVARLVPKKNLAMLLEAFAIYRASYPDRRRLILCGSGPLEAELRAQADRLEIGESVVFTGFVQTDEVSRYLARALALLLPSVEEQFGNVVIEAQAMGLPVIVSDNCGARDRLVRSGVNGFVIEPDNPEGLAYFMSLLARDAKCWTNMSSAAAAGADRGDDERFAEGVEALVHRRIAVTAAA